MAKKDDFLPKTKAEFEAFARAMDEANDMIASKKPAKKPAKKAPAKKSTAKTKKK